MEQAFIINPHATQDSLKNALYEKTAQARAMANCLLFANNQIADNLLYDAIWAVVAQIEQIEQLQTCMKEAG